MVFQVVDIRKQYDGNVILENVSLTLSGGKVHGIVGYNGAGKSTLAKIAGGIIQRDSGMLVLDGKEIKNWDVKNAMRAGVFLADYHSTLLPELTVLENMLYGLNSVRMNGLNSIFFKQKKIEKLLEENIQLYGLNCKKDTPVIKLSGSQKNMLELVRIKMFHPKVLIIDEADSNINDFYRDQIKKMIAEFKNQGTAILYISHQIDRVMELSDEISIILDSHLVETVKVKEISSESMLEMLFHVVNEHPPKTIIKPQAKILEIQHITNSVMKDFSMDVREGEIVGIIGLQKEGPASFEEILFADNYDRNAKGRLLFRERELKLITPQDAISAGIVFLDANVMDNYLFQGRSVCENMIPFSIKIKCRSKEQQTAICQSYLDRLSIDAKPEDIIEHVSTGFQKKILIARNILSEGELYIFNSPTDNIDIVSKIDIYNIINELKSRGNGIILISNDYHEVAGISDVIIAVQNGKIMRKFNNYSLNEKEIFNWE